MVKNMHPGDDWIPGVILKHLGPVSFQVDVGEGRTWKRHINHIKIRDLPNPVTESVQEETPEDMVPELTLMEPNIVAPAHYI